ncbi:hypothetical protein BA177_12450 [Woeseia oceani]|uniref:Transcriptional regulator n=1 Tax=Woeseia oceani TaxID=1548547 RepID=A0A193LH99_9GAMM|nr:hypothetical protein BA177_12450 [Woeseia oceani]
MRGKQQPSRSFDLASQAMRGIRERTELDQENVASLMHISAATLRCREQGRDDRTVPPQLDSRLYQIIRSP